MGIDTPNSALDNPEITDLYRTVDRHQRQLTSSRPKLFADTDAPQMLQMNRFMIQASTVARRLCHSILAAPPSATTSDRKNPDELA